MKLFLILANIELYLTQPYVIIHNNKIIKQFDTINAEAQCQQYAKWYGRNSICIKK